MVPILHPGESSYPKQLSLVSGVMNCQSYVRLEHILLVSIKSLWMLRWYEGCHAYDTRLDKESYQWLANAFGIEGDEYQKTRDVVNLAKARNRALARGEVLRLNEKYDSDYGLSRRSEDGADYRGYNDLDAREYQDAGYDSVRPGSAATSSLGFQGSISNDFSSIQPMPGSNFYFNNSTAVFNNSPPRQNYSLLPQTVQTMYQQTPSQWNHPYEHMEQQFGQQKVQQTGYQTPQYGPSTASSIPSLIAQRYPPPRNFPAQSFPSQNHPPPPNLPPQNWPPQTPANFQHPALAANISPPVCESTGPHHLPARPERSWYDPRRSIQANPSLPQRPAPYAEQRFSASKGYVNNRFS